jgi:DNA polymerase elongation subunit (family B)
VSNYIYDIETYPNVFQMNALEVGSDNRWGFEISDWRDDSALIVQFLEALRDQGSRMVGFNNIGFDYPVIHQLYQMKKTTARSLYDKAMAIINGEAWTHWVKPSDRVVEQIDLFKIHHFDNRARSTSLKALEFNMRMENVEDLPFPVGIELDQNKAEVLRSYCWNDIDATLRFYEKTIPMIEFRETLTRKYGRDFMNHNDTKIGKDFFIMKLEEAGVQCYSFGDAGREPLQTLRPQIALGDAILPWIEFHSEEFQHMLDWLKGQTITETKGVFKDVSCVVNGFKFVFGLGGIHGSIESEVVESDDEYQVIDLDVTSYYPSLAIVNRFYPEHLSEKFCDIYSGLKDQRVHYAKGTPENAMLKLALNGVYGDSNNVYSPFYDPLFTMKITLNGQLLLCLLAERLMGITDLRLVQCNTDGLTIRIHKDSLPSLRFVTNWWEIITGLQLEWANYRRMFIRDVNNYIAEYTHG